MWLFVSGFSHLAEYFLRFIHVIPSVLDSFLLLNNIPFYECTTFCIQSSGDGYLTCFHFLAIMHNDSMSICVQVFVRTSLFRSRV